MKFRVATWNINSIRIRIDILKNVIKNNNIDVILLQETKCQDRDFPIDDIQQNIGFNYVFKGQKSYNGVAILSKYPIELVMDKLPLYDKDNNDEEARYIEAIINVEKKIVRLASIYVPNGASLLKYGETLEESARFNYKLNFYERMKKRILEIKQDSDGFSDEYIVLAGDLNVAQDEIDLHNPKLNDGNVCFHPLEREKLREIKSIGLYDVFRFKYPNVKQYTWWDYKTRGFDRNVGWRLDYFLCSKNVIDSLNEIYVDMKTRGQQKTSDHAPSILEFDIN